MSAAKDHLVAPGDRSAERLASRNLIGKGRQHG